MSGIDAYHNPERLGAMLIVNAPKVSPIFNLPSFYFQAPSFELLFLLLNFVFKLIGCLFVLLDDILLAGRDDCKEDQV